MKIKINLIFPVLIYCGMIFFSYGNLKADENFYAYYTKLDIGNIVEDTYGKYADIVIQFSGDREVLFSRESSYLPCLVSGETKRYFPEISDRTGDGSKLRPDKYNRYSYVRIIENDPDKIVVHWRYVSQFNVAGQSAFTDEYFNFYPDGKVDRTVRQGTEKLDDWNDPANITTQILQLSDGKLEIISTQEAELTRTELPPQNGSEVVTGEVSSPVFHLKFDDALKTREYDKRDLTEETVRGELYEVNGNKTLWKKGVSGTALGFDGYTSSISIPAEDAPKSDIISNGFTVEAWIAIGANSWRWAPIVHQSEWGKRGYYLGINDAGHLGLMAQIGSNWEEVVSKDPLERFRWTHVAGSYNIEDGLLCIYIDGELVRCNRTKIEINPEFDEVKLETASEIDLLIGFNNELMQATNAHREWTYPMISGFDGLIDEVKIYPEPLSWDDIKKSYELYKPDLNLTDIRKFPANPNGKPAEKFGAEYTTLDYYEHWDNMWRVSDHADIVVGFENKPVGFAFWRGTSYGIGMITENGKWSGDQSREEWGWGESQARGCCEHMSDKQCRHSHVRIIENTDARTVIHWRYGEVDVKYKFVENNGPFADEYWTFYPDGVGIRHVASGKGGWQETMFYSEPGTRPEDNVEYKALTVIDEEGNTVEYDWKYNYPYAGQAKAASITMVNMKSEYRPFYIYPTGSSVESFVPPLVRRDYSAFHWANHYPVSQMASDGRSAEANDRASHSSLVWGDPTQDYLMVGLTNKDPAELMDLARSWNYPASLTEAVGCISKEYKPEERAYQLDKTDEKISFTLNGSKESPIHNPAFVIKNWADRDKKAVVKFNSKELVSGEDYRQGVSFDTDGRPQLIIWIDYRSTSKTQIEIR